MVNTCFHADGHGGTVNRNRGDYVRRYVPEPAARSRTSIHTPWPLDSGLAYPGPPLVELS